MTNLLNLFSNKPYLIIICLIISIIIIIVMINSFKVNREFFYAGNINSQDKLNRTLLVIIKILNVNNIKNWFVGYGTLLGIVRENSCIDGDDDNDIVCDILNYETIKKTLTKHGFTFENIDSTYILKNQRNQ